MHFLCTVQQIITFVPLYIYCCGYRVCFHLKSKIKSMVISVSVVSLQTMLGMACARQPCVPTSNYKQLITGLVPLIWCI